MLSRVQAQNYKCLKDIDIDLKPFMILIGPNGSGKNTLLDIFVIIRDILNLGPQNAVTKRCANLPELIWKRANGYFAIALEIIIPEDKRERFRYARYEIVISLDDKDRICIERENLFLLNENDKFTDHRQYSLFKTGSGLTPPTEITRKCTPPGWHKIISKTSNGNDYFHSENTKWSISYRFGPQRAAISSIPEDETHFPISLWIKSALTEGIRPIQLNCNAMHYPCRPDSLKSIESDGANLPKVIKNLQTIDPNGFKKWVEYVKSTLPEIEDIEIKERQEDRYLYISIRQRGGHMIPSWLLSDGILRYLAQTLIPYLPEMNKLYIIKEPENGLDTKGVENICHLLSAVKKNQILLATHSPVIKKLTESEKILYFARSHSGAINIVTGKDVQG